MFDIWNKPEGLTSNFVILTVVKFRCGILILTENVQFLCKMSKACISMGPLFFFNVIDKNNWVNLTNDEEENIYKNIFCTKLVWVNLKNF